MDLILWRHAEAHPARNGQRDLDRALTLQGERQAARMAEWLQGRLPPATRIIASPALRCQQTAQALRREVDTQPGLSPAQGGVVLLQTAGWPNAAAAVLVVGHQPTLGAVAAQLLAGSAQPWPFKKAAVWWLCQRERDGDSQVALRAVMSPDFL